MALFKVLLKYTKPSGSTCRVTFMVSADDDTEAVAIAMPLRHANEPLGNGCKVLSVDLVPYGLACVQVDKWTKPTT